MLVLLALLALTEFGSAADKIILTCSGTTFFPTTGTVPAPDQTFDIDPDGMIRSSLGDFPITDMDDERVVFKYADDKGDIVGNINRLTGNLTISYGEGTKEVESYNLTCKRTSPLF